jgi:short-chain fatty acids transporter
MTTVKGPMQTLAHHISTFSYIASHDPARGMMGVYRQSSVLHPSGGGKWIIEAPYVMQVANT